MTAVRSMALGVLGACVLNGVASAQVGGNLAALPAVDLDIAVTTSPSGAPELSPAEIRLTTGEYYRLNITSDGGAVWRVEAADLLQNSHLRLVTINGVEVHLQGLTFRAIEFDEAGSASFTLTPIRPGDYDLYIGPNPYALGRPIGEAGPQAGAETVIGRIIVE